jgi:hypothetical protein
MPKYSEGTAAALAELDAIEKYLEANPVMTRSALRGFIAERVSQHLSGLLVPNSGPATSRKAAQDSIVIRSAKSLRFRALAVYASGPATDEEVGDELGHPRIWPRCSELRSVGMIEPNGDTRLVKRTGQFAEVCRITDLGLRTFANFATTIA